MAMAIDKFGLTVGIYLGFVGTWCVCIINFLYIKYIFDIYLFGCKNCTIAAYGGSLWERIQG